MDWDRWVCRARRCCAATACRCKRSTRIWRFATLAASGDSSGVESTHGDCRNVEVLRRAGVDWARAVLLVTGDSRTNVEAALAARRLNPTIRIVARTAQDNISQVLTDRLSNFVAYEPSRLAAGALALAASSSEVIGHFHVDGRLVRVLRRPVEADSRWQGAAIKELGRHGVVVLDHAGAAVDDPVNPMVAPPDEDLFYGHDQDCKVQEGDVLTLLSVERVESMPRPPEPRARRTLADVLHNWRRSLRRPAGVVLTSLIVVSIALLISAAAFPTADGALTHLDGIFTALVLMTGGTYADLFPPFGKLSNSLRLLSVTLSAIGTVFVGLLYAFITERVMTLGSAWGRGDRQCRGKDTWSWWAWDAWAATPPSAYKNCNNRWRRSRPMRWGNMRCPSCRW